MSCLEPAPPRHHCPVWNQRHTDITDLSGTSAPQTSLSCLQQAALRYHCPVWNQRPSDITVQSGTSGPQTPAGGHRCRATAQPGPLRDLTSARPGRATPLAYCPVQGRPEHLELQVAAPAVLWRGPPPQQPTARAPGLVLSVQSYSVGLLVCIKNRLEKRLPPSRFVPGR